MATLYPTADDRSSGGRARRHGFFGKGLIAEIRDAKRSPFYRKELRQPTNVSMVLVGLGMAFLAFLVVLIVSLMCCFTMPFAVSFPAMVFPGVLVAEGMLYEFERGTMESLLLTTAGRKEILFAKFAARLRPIVFIAVVVAAATAIGGLALGASASFGEYNHTATENLLWAACGLGCGALAGAIIGLMLVAQAATGGAFAIYTVISTRSRTASYSLLMLISAGISLVESILFGALLAVGGVIVMTAASERDEEGAIIAAIILGAVTLAIFAIRTVFLSWFVPLWVVRHCARRLDSILLADS